MSDQIEFSYFFRLLNSIKEGDSKKISLVDEKISEFKNGINSKSFLEELGSLYLYIGITELYNFTSKKDLKSIGLIDREGWESLSITNDQELPVFLANKKIKYVKENKKTKPDTMSPGSHGYWGANPYELLLDFKTDFYAASTKK